MFTFQKKKLIGSILVACLVLFLCLSISSLESGFFTILRHPLIIFSSLKRELGGLIFFHRNLNENKKLRKELGLLRQKLNSLTELDLENQRLRKIASLKQQASFKVICARVIGRSSDSWSSGLVIDKGSYHGIRRGMPAITYLGLAGSVIETNERTSKVLLISDPNFSVSAAAQRTRQEGLVSGTLGNNLIMRYLAEDADIQVNDTIISSGLNPVYPKGLLIGTVVGTGKEFSGLSSYALIKPAVNLSNIEEILIIVR